MAENTGDGPRRRYVKRQTAQARAYSQAVITEGGRIVWLAGQVGAVDASGNSLAGDFDGQVREVFARLNQTLETRRIKRVPVVRDGKLVGILSRANLVRALAAAGSRLSADTAIDDRTIRQKLLAELQGQDWVHAWAADIIVRDGIVHIWVPDDRPEEEQQALRVAAENVPGVRGVEEHIVPAPIINPAF